MDRDVTSFKTEEQHCALHHLHGRLRQAAGTVERKHVAVHWSSLCRHWLTLNILKVIIGHGRAFGCHWEVICGVQCARYVAKIQSNAEELEAQVRKQMEEDQAVNCFVGRIFCYFICFWMLLVLQETWRHGKTRAGQSIWLSLEDAWTTIAIIVEGSLEVKLPIIWTDEKQRREESENIREERRSTKRESQERRSRCAKR